MLSGFSLRCCCQASEARGLGISAARFKPKQAIQLKGFSRPALRVKSCKSKIRIRKPCNPCPALFCFYLFLLLIAAYPTRRLLHHVQGRM